MGLFFFFKPFRLNKLNAARRLHPLLVYPIRLLIMQELMHGWWCAGNPTVNLKKKDAQTHKFKQTVKRVDAEFVERLDRGPYRGWGSFVDNTQHTKHYTYTQHIHTQSFRKKNLVEVAGACASWTKLIHPSHLGARAPIFASLFRLLFSPVQCAAHCDAQERKLRASTMKC